MTEEKDIFDDLGNLDLSGVETTMPVIHPGSYTFTIKGIERKEWNSGKGSSLVINYALDEEAPDVSGDRVCSPGYPLIDRISLVAKGNYDPMVNIARWLEAVGMKDQPFDKTFESYLGLSIVIQTKIAPESTGADGTVYSARAEVQRYVKA